MHADGDKLMRSDHPHADMQGEFMLKKNYKF